METSNPDTKRTARLRRLHASKNRLFILFQRAKIKRNGGGAMSGIPAPERVSAKTHMWD
jgi:hypothetical protein